NAFHLFAKPSAPTIGAVTPGNGTVNVTWTAPSTNNGSAITSYTVTPSGGVTPVTVAYPATQADVPGLTNGTSYTFTVHATNVAGNGAESAASSSVTPRTKPDAPTGIGATPGNGKATVSWTAPANNGGSAITGYTVTASPGGATATV